MPLDTDTPGWGVAVCIGNPDTEVPDPQGTAAGAGAGTEASHDGVRFDTLQRALVESQAQCRTAQDRIDSLARRITRLEKELVALAYSEQHARHLAYHDALTGLANRALLQDRLRQAIAQAQRGHRLVAVLLIDLDGFKRINDTLGHAAGDHLLRAVAARLSASIRGADTACRHGGDEFVVMLPEVDDPAMVNAVVAKVHAHLSEPHVIDGHEIRITASVGCALYPSHGTSYEQLMKHADAGMYLAKAVSFPAAIEALPALRQEVPTDRGAPQRVERWDAASFRREPRREAGEARTKRPDLAPA